MSTSANGWIELSELDGKSLAESALFIEDRGRAAGRKNLSAKPHFTGIALGDRDPP
jgi:hypothetical protein